jgi:hypothetical protein
MDSNESSNNFRKPEWLEETKRWRMRIGHHVGRNGKRVERLFYWPAADNSGGTPPLHIITEAVQFQKEWRKIRSEWKTFVWKLRAVFPDRDWSKPIWATDELAQIAAGEIAGVQQALATFDAEEIAYEQQQQQQVASWVARHGLAALMDALRVGPEEPAFPAYAPESYRARVLQRMASERATALAELAPVEKRAMVATATKVQTAADGGERYQRPPRL